MTDYPVRYAVPTLQLTPGGYTFRVYDSFEEASKAAASDDSGVGLWGGGLIYEMRVIATVERSCVVKHV